jgi:hypothetical protein
MGGNGDTVCKRLQKLFATEARAAAGGKENAHDVRWNASSHGWT